jgi:hypothetical protein
MKHKVLLLTSLTITVGTLSSIIVRVRAQAQTYVPFTAQVTHRLFKYPSGEFAMSLDETIAIRSDGSFAKIRERADNTGQPYTIRGVTDLAAKKDFTADGLTRSITSGPVQAAVAASAARKPSACKVDVPGESSQLLGYKVLKSTSPTITRIGGEIRYNVSWVAPDLDCYALKTVTYRQLPGKPLMAATVTQVLRVVPGEPDQSLFAAPAGYKERSPSMVLKTRSEMLGKPAPAPSTATLLDKIYDSRNKRSGSQ